MCTDLMWRGALLLAAVALGLAGAPTAVRAPVLIVAVAVTVARLARLRGRGAVDTVVVGVGGLLVALVLLGLALNFVPGGLSARSWTAGVGVLGVVGLAIVDYRTRQGHLPAASGEPGSEPLWSTPVRLFSRLPLSALGYPLAAVVAVIAVVISIRATDSAERAPLSLSIEQATEGSATVVVSSSRRSGPYELLVDDGSGRQLIQGPFVLQPGQSLRRAASIPIGRRVTVMVTNSSQDEALRSVVLQPR